MEELKKKADTKSRYAHLWLVSCANHSGFPNNMWKEWENMCEHVFCVTLGCRPSSRGNRFDELLNCDLRFENLKSIDFESCFENNFRSFFSSFILFQRKENQISSHTTFVAESSNGLLRVACCFPLCYRFLSAQPYKFVKEQSKRITHTHTYTHHDDDLRCSFHLIFFFIVIRSDYWLTDQIIDPELRSESKISIGKKVNYKKCDQEMKWNKQKKK